MLDLLRGELSAHAAGSDGPGESGDCDPDAQAALLEIKDALIQNIPHEWLRRFDDEGDSSQAFGLDFAPFVLSQKTIREKSRPWTIVW